MVDIKKCKDCGTPAEKRKETLDGKPIEVWAYCCPPTCKSLRMRAEKLAMRKLIGKAS